MPNKKDRQGTQSARGFRPPISAQAYFVGAHKFSAPGNRVTPKERRQESNEEAQPALRPSDAEVERERGRQRKKIQRDTTDGWRDAYGAQLWSWWQAVAWICHRDPAKINALMPKPRRGARWYDD